MSRISRLTGVLIALFLGAQAIAQIPYDTFEAPGQLGAVTGISLRLLRDPRIGTNRVAVITEDSLYCYPPTHDLILIPKGYMTDFASVPPVVDKVIDKYGNNIDAAVVHDWLYAVGQPGKRQYADELFRFALSEQGTGLVERNLAFEGVRLGGEKAYGNAAEWEKRFYDPAGTGFQKPKFSKPKSAIVAVLASCNAMESVDEIRRLLKRYSSENWK